MRENRTYGSVRGGQSNLIPSTRLTRPRCEGCGRAPLNYRRRPLMENLHNRPAGEGNAFPLWCLTAPPSPRSSVGRQKENALMGRLGALLRPIWRSYAGPPQWHYKAPLCCELLMKGLLFRALFFPRNRGKSGAARIGGGERSEPVSRIVFMPYDTEK